jgi:hypothetical protein
MAACCAAGLLAFWCGGAPMAAQDEPKGKEKNPLPPDLALVPPEAFGFLCLQLWRGENTLGKLLFRQLSKDRPVSTRRLEEKMGVRLKDVERLIVLKLSPDDEIPLLIVTTEKPYDRDRLFKTLVPDPRKNDYKGTVYFTSKRRGRNAVQPVNDRVFVTGPVEDVVQNLVFRARAKPTGPLSPALRTAAGKHQLVAACSIQHRDRKKLVANALQGLLWSGLGSVVTQTILPLAQARAAFLVVDAGKEITLQAHLPFPDGARAEKAEWPMKDGLAFLRMLLRAGKVKLVRQKGMARFLPLMNQAEHALRAAKVVRKDKDLHVVVRSKTNPAVAFRTFLDAVFLVRDSVLRDKTAYRVGAITIGLLDYHEKHHHFPAPAIYDKKGKPLLSWRVAILPFIGEEKLYKQFRLTEPWDSASNKKLLARMPWVYRVPGTKSKSPYATFYQAIVGPGAAFEGHKEMKILGDFPDGTSNTLLIAEATKPVPWTKPADLSFDPRKPLPQFGGIFEDVFCVGFADGNVRFFEKKIDKKTLRALITRAGGEEIKFPD